MKLMIWLPGFDKRFRNSGSDCVDIEPGSKILIYQLQTDKTCRPPITAFVKYVKDGALHVWETENKISREPDGRNIWYACEHIELVSGYCAECQKTTGNEEDYLCEDCRNALDKQVLNP